MPPGQLLEFETGKHGYNELAAFLGVTAPDAPYPRTHSADEFAFVINIMRFFAVLTCAAGYTVFWLACRMNRAAARKEGAEAKQAAAARKKGPPSKKKD